MPALATLLVKHGAGSMAGVRRDLEGTRPGDWLGSAPSTVCVVGWTVSQID